MRRPAWVVAAMLGLAAPVSGASAATVWQGEAVVTAAIGCTAPPGQARRNFTKVP